MLSVGISVPPDTSMIIVNGTLFSITSGYLWGSEMKRILKYKTAIGAFAVILLLVFGSIATSAQETQAESSADLLNRARNDVYTNTGQSITILQYLLERDDRTSHRSRIHLTLAHGYYLKGDYSEGLKNAFKALDGAADEELAGTTNEARLLIAEILVRLGLFDMSKSFIREAEEKSPGDSSMKSIHNEARLVQAWRYEIQDMPDSAKAAYQDVISAARGESGVNDRSLITEAYLGLALRKVNTGESAGVPGLLKEVTVRSGGLTHAGYYRMLAGLAWGQFYLESGNHKSSRDSLLAALDIAIILENSTYLPILYGNLATLALKAKNISDFREYHQKALVWDDAMERQRHFERAGAVHLILKTREKRGKILLSAMRERNYIFMAVAGLLIIIALSLRFWYDLKMRHFKEIILYLKLKAPKPKPLPDRVENTDAAVSKRPSSPQIPIETEEKIKSGLDDFELGTTFTDSDISLARLAAELGVNTKYLSATIHKLKGRNYNQYINHLRIDYVIEKLKSDDQYRKFKLAYIADEAGFSSHSNFTTVFKQVSGLAPARFIALLNSEKVTEL